MHLYLKKRALSWLSTLSQSISLLSTKVPFRDALFWDMAGIYTSLEGEDIQCKPTETLLWLSVTKEMNWRKWEPMINVITKEIEHGSFTPFVFSIADGMGTTSMVAYNRLASLLDEKHNWAYNMTLHWLRCRLNFSLLQSATMCLCGSHSILQGH